MTPRNFFSFAIFFIIAIFSNPTLSQTYEYDPHGYVWYSGGNPHNIEVKCYNFSSDNHKTKFRVQKHDGNDFGADVTIYIHRDSPNGSVVEDIDIDEGDSYGTSGYYYFDDDVTDDDGRDYYATLYVGGFTHIAGPINIYMEEPERLSTPVITQPSSGSNLYIPVTIQWNSIPNADVYRVVVFTSMSGFDNDPPDEHPSSYEVYNSTITSTSVSISAQYLNPSQTYYATVRAGAYDTYYHSLFCSPVQFQTIPEPDATISGYIKDQNGIGIGGVEIGFSNGYPSIYTYGNGSYSKTFPYGTSVTVTPSKSGYTFNPSSRSYSNLTSNQTNQNYTGTHDPITISGYVKDGNNVGISDVNISFSNDGGSATTNSSGYYSKSISYGYSGTSTPTKSGYNFNPTYRNYSEVTSSQSNQNFTGILNYYTISGRVTENGTGLSNVTISFTNGAGSVSTDGNGDYSKSVSYGYSGSCSASKDGYTFSPTSHTFSNLTGNISGKNFTGALLTYTISGTITENGSGLSGVNILFSNNGGSTATNSSGNYSVTVPYGYTGFSTPAKDGYTFSPANRNYTDISSNQSNQNFAGTLGSVIISGRVTENGTGLSNVTVSFTNGAGSVTTDSNGDYSKSVSYGYTGSCSASKDGYTFTPSSHTFNNVVSNVSGKNFIGTINTVSISGYIKDQNNNAISNANISFTNGGGSVSTNSSGYYSVTVPYNYSGTATPSKTDYTFTPPSRSYSNVIANINNENYTGVEEVYISGYKLPFPPGYNFSITNSYGDGFHQHQYDDYYCVDFNLSGTADKGVPILAVRDGTIVYAQNTGNSYGNRVEIDHGDGNISNYSHGSYICINEGEYVHQGQEIMVIWDSGTDGGSHLHFEIESYDPTSGEYISTELPEMSGYTSYASGSSGYISDNIQYFDGKLIEENQAQITGITNSFNLSGHNQNFYYSDCVSINDDPTVICKWTPNFDQPTVADVFLYLPGYDLSHATTCANYYITHQDGLRVVNVNQYSIRQPQEKWVNLGRYTFGSGQQYHVKLSNAVSDHTNDNPKDIDFDAIYFKKVNEGGGGSNNTPALLSFQKIRYDTVLYVNHNFSIELNLENIGEIDISTSLLTFSIADTQNDNLSNHIYYNMNDILYPDDTLQISKSYIITDAGNYDLIIEVLTEQGNIFQWRAPITVQNPTDIIFEEEIPKEYFLHQNYPNPFNPSTKIQYDLPEDSNIKIEVFNILGKSIAILVNKFKEAGSYNMNFDASDLTNGIYFYRITSDKFCDTKKMILLK